MKKTEKTFNIYKGDRPKVLLLGNGLCRAYGGISWDKLLDTIKDKNTYPHSADKYILPMPLKAVMLTNNSLRTKIKNVVNNKEDGSDFGWHSFTHTTQEMREQIRHFVKSGFDYVLTTNYSYEIEAALLDRDTLSPGQITRLMEYHEVDRAQPRYLTNTYNCADGVPVWHIHGEARKPESMILGHSYYGKILRRCVERIDSSKDTEFRKNIKNKIPQKIGSWIDAFVLGDVYILGLGLDFSEMDLWWLLEYKKNNQEFCGNTVFYDPITVKGSVCVYDNAVACSNAASFISGDECKKMLLNEVYGVQINNLDITIRCNDDYKPFYQKAIEDIGKRISKNSNHR